MLAFDHRASFREKLFAIRGTPTLAQKRKIEMTKETVFDAVMQAIRNGRVARREAAVLCDEEYGATVLRRARQAGVAFALPVEKSGCNEFQFEYGKNFAAHVRTFKPDFVKVLVRYNPANKTLNKRQLARLRQLQQWLDANGGKLLFEMLVPPTKSQLNLYGKNFDGRARPALTVAALREITAAGVRPTVWKLEGVDSKRTAREVFGAALAFAPGSRAIVLGRGESLDRVKKWVATAAAVPGVEGFAVGRTIFREPLAKMIAGKATRAQTVKEMADTYAQIAACFRKAHKN